MKEITKKGLNKYTVNILVPHILTIFSPHLQLAGNKGKALAKKMSEEKGVNCLLKEVKQVKDKV